MKKSLMICTIALIVSFAGNFYMAQAEQNALDDLQDVYQNTAAFDGGPGSTINTSPAAYDAQQGRDPYQVPDVGEGVPVQ